MYVKEFEKKFQQKDTKQQTPLDPEKLTSVILEFVENTTYGQLSGLFRIYGTSLKTMQNRQNVLKGATANYFNTCLKSLILQDDPYVVEWFNKFWLYCSHSPICLSHVLFNLVCSIQEKIDFSQLDYSSLDKFRESERFQIKLIIEILRESVKTMISHECHGEKLEDLDPDTPLFQIVKG